MSPLSPIPPKRKSGAEPFHDNGQPLGCDVLSFWQWSVSDLLSNATRGILAEFIVAQALGLAKGLRVEWDPWDLTTPDGIKVEVKTAGYIQSWAQKAPSYVSYSIRPTWGWDPETNTFGGEPKRHADVYVFCLLHHIEQATIDPLNIDQWTFYVLATRVLNKAVPEQKTIALSRLISIGAVKTSYQGLASAVSQAME